MGRTINLITAGKHPSWALAVLSGMVEVNWAFLGAQDASECHAPLGYHVFGGLSARIAELVAAWDAM